MASTIQELKLFQDIEDLDKSICDKLVSVVERPAVVICKVNLPPGELFRLTGTDYGIYALFTDGDGRDAVVGSRTGRSDGKLVYNVIVSQIKQILEARSSREPRMFDFEFNVRYM